MTPFNKFNISSISTKLNTLNMQISVANNKPLPCLVLLSNYRFQKRFVKILPNGDIRGGSLQNDHLFDRFFFCQVVVRFLLQH